MQVTTITLEQMQKLMDASKKHDKPIEVDWANRTIQVLSEMKPHPSVVLSSGPMRYQDRLVSFKF